MCSKKNSQFFPSKLDPFTVPIVVSGRTTYQAKYFGVILRFDVLSFCMLLLLSTLVLVHPCPLLYYHNSLLISFPASNLPPYTTCPHSSQNNPSKTLSLILTLCCSNYCDGFPQQLEYIFKSRAAKPFLF